MIKKIIFPYELIGEEVEIASAKNRYDQGLKGRITDETKETIVIRVQGKPSTFGSKRLFKKNITLKMIKTGQSIEGKALLRRPEERIKG